MCILRYFRRIWKCRKQAVGIWICWFVSEGGGGKQVVSGGTPGEFGGAGGKQLVSGGVRGKQCVSRGEGGK